MSKESKNRTSMLYACATILVILDILYYAYVYLHQFGVTNIIFDVLLKICLDAGLYKNIFITKTGVLIALLVAAISNKGMSETDFSWMSVITFLSVGLFFFFFSMKFAGAIYIILVIVGYLIMLYSFAKLSQKIGNNYNLDEDKDTFMQDTVLRKNEDSINIPTIFQYKKKKYKGWINIVNPFRATMVLGTPGSGKSYAVYSFFMRQMIEKGYTMYLYDYKYPDLTYEIYNILRDNADKYAIQPSIYILNFDNPEYSHRANPINAKFLDEIMDAYEAAYTVMINLNKSWIQKQGDFFVESPIILFAAIIWFLKIYQNGKYCTLPHAIEMLMQPFENVFDVLVSYDELHNYLTPFINAKENNAQDQLQGQIASAQIPLTRLSSPTLYWVMSGDDFTLDINNPDEPKIVCCGNNPDRQNIYGAALSLYNSRIIKIINRKKRLKCAVLLDELPTIYIKGLDNLIATARSNRVAITCGAQDFSQIIRDYGDKEADVIANTIGNLFSGMVKGKTADSLSKSFGKEHKKKQSKSIGEDNSSISISYQLEDILPASKIGSLSQGEFVGQVADNFNQKIDKKFFHAEIVVDNEKRKKEQRDWEDIPKLAEVEQGNLKDLVQQNYKKIKGEMRIIMNDELKRLESNHEDDDY
ncbi:MAG: TraM recognition domain-containing protein [Bacteroidales bacterium]